MSMHFEVGDYVTLFSKFTAQIVCDYEHGRCMAGYESWLEEPIADGASTGGYLLWTPGMNFIRYEEISEDDHIVFDRKPTGPADRLQR